MSSKLPGESNPGVLNAPLRSSFIVPDSTAKPVYVGERQRSAKWKGWLRIIGLSSVIHWVRRWREGDFRKCFAREAEMRMNIFTLSEVFFKELVIVRRFLKLQGYCT